MPKPKKLAARPPAPGAERCNYCGGIVKFIDLYCRVSEDYDNTGGLRSVDDQVQDGTEFIEDELPCCFRVGEVFKDPDLSGWNVNVVRPEFNRCMERVTAGAAFGLWVYDITRFSRKPDEGRLLIDASDRGHVLYSDNKARDLQDPDDRKWFRDQLNEAEAESLRLRRRVTRGKKNKVQRRGKSNASTRGFGMDGFKRPPPKELRGERFIPVPEDATVVTAERAAIRRVADMMLNGATNASCIRWLNREGFRTYFGNEWSSATFRTMMTRPSLAGYLTYHDEIVPGKSLPEPWVLDRDDWDDIQTIMASRQRGPTPERHLLAGILRCGICGRGVQGATRGTKYVGPKRWTYRCKGQSVNGLRVCGKVDISKAVADEVVTAAVLRRLADARHRAHLVDLSEQGSVRKQEIRAQIAEAEANESALASKLGTGAMKLETFEAFVAQNAARLARLRAEDDAIVLPKVPKKKTADEARKMWDDAADNIRVRRQMIREAFPNLTLMPAKLRGRNAAQPERIVLDGPPSPRSVVMGA